MEIYHFSRTTISHGKGQSTVCARSYRAAEKIMDVRIGVNHLFSKNKLHLIHKNLLLSEQAPALKTLTQGCTRFSEQNLVQFIRRHSATDEQFDAVFAAIKKHRAFGSEHAEQSE